MDGRFHRQYLAANGGRDVRNWGSLGKADLEPFNLLLLTGGNPRIPYRDDARRNVLDFARRGGTVLLMADGADPDLPAHAGRGLPARALDQAAAGRCAGWGTRGGVDRFRQGNVLELLRDGIDPPWTPLVVDRDGRPVLAARSSGAEAAR